MHGDSSHFSRSYSVRSHLRYSVRRCASVRLSSSSVTLCILAKRCVLEQKLLLTSIGNKMKDLDLCLEVVSRSRQPLRYIRCWIYRKLSETEAWFQSSCQSPATSKIVKRCRSWVVSCKQRYIKYSDLYHMRNDIWGIKWSRDRWRHVTLKGQARDPNTLRVQYLENGWR